MKHKSFILTLIAVALVSLFSYSQEPAHFVIGANELANTDVYSICQTEEGILYAATNNGLYEYRHGQFKSIRGADNQHGNSLFHLKLDQKGQLFCGNLSGQILRLNRGKLEVFFELKKKDIGHELMYEFDVNNHLIIAGKTSCFDVSNGKVKNLYENKKGIQSLAKLIDGRIVIGVPFGDSCITIKNGVVTSKDVSEYNRRQDYSPFRMHWFQFGKNLFNVYSNGAIAMLGKGSFINDVSPNRNERVYQFDNGEVWALDHAAGIREISLENDSKLVSSQTYFENNFISAIAKGNNDLFFLGTFNNGIFVIPNQTTKKHKVSYKGGEMNSLAVDNDNNVFISTRDGQVIHYNKTTVSIDKTIAKAVDKIFYIEGVNFGVNNSFPSLLYNGTKMHFGKIPIGSIKDTWKIGDSSALIASSSGIFKTNCHEEIGSFQDDAMWQRIEENNLSKLKSVLERCKSVTYSPDDELIYVATHTALLEIDRYGKSRELFFEGGRIIAMDLFFYEGLLWCSTLKNGILVFEQGVLKRVVDQKNGLGINSARKIEIKNDKLFVSHKNGFQILDLISDKWIALGTAEGVINGSVNDFALSADKLWIISKGQPLSLDLNNLPQTEPKLTVSIDSLIVSDNKYEDNKLQQFTHDQNDFAFYFTFRGIEYEAEATILYRIKGFEDKWNSTPSTSNVIEYKYLPPGNYAFEIKVKFRNSFSETKRHKFEITPPFWTTVWFFLIIGFVLVILLSVFYFYQLKKIAKRNSDRLAKQKNETDRLDSELKALRSQMNPHFIFNSLNSIQDLILQQDTDASYDYIVLFADLVRSTLNYSNKDFIPIDKELEFLDVYLSLEKLRFEDDFSYEISYIGDKGINVPSLIVQPFIENALVHGLLHKRGKKNLKIVFEYTDELTCTITDNGVGRVRAKEIQKRQGNHHESFALEAINKRLSILKEQYGENVGYVIYDLFSEDLSAGTKVVIRMPFVAQY